MSQIAMPVVDQRVIAGREKIISDLTDLLGSEAVISDYDGRKAFDTDALTAYHQMPLAVVLPSDTDGVSKALRYCNQNHIKVVARGAGTSLAGGALPLEDAIVIGVSKMNRVLDVNYQDRTARVEAGITNLGISDAVSADGFFYAPDPSSQLACTLAGNIAMNSGGAHCLKYGVTTNNILGVKVVLLDGAVVEIGGAYLDSPGYDLLGLMVGSEGQFGIVTEATVRILRAAEDARPMLMGFETTEAAMSCVSGIIASGIIPVAMEFMDRPAIKVCEDFAKAGYPLDVDAMLIIEVEGSEAEIDKALSDIKTIAEPYNPTVVQISESAEQSAAIWKGRKSAFGAIGRIADYMCMDGTIPLGALPHVLPRITEICRSYGFEVANIFHAGDGNLHPLILYSANEPGQIEQVEAAGAEILKLCVEVGGCLTGEHGVGIEKRDLMLDQFEQVDLDQQIRIKSIFDPHWLLNTAKVFPLDTRNAA